MALKIAGQSKQALTATGNQDFMPVIHGTTNFVFAGDVKAALLFGSAAALNSTLSANAHFALGMTDGTTHVLLNTSGTDAANPTDWATRLQTGRCAGFMTGVPADLSVATASLQTNGIRLNWTTVDSNANRVCALIIGGAGVEAQVVSASFVGGAAETKTISHSLSGAPDIVIAMSSAFTINSSAAQGRNSYGFYARATNAYVSLATTRLDGQASELISQELLTDCIVAEITNAGVINYKVTLANFTATSFDAITSANAGTDGIAFLLLKVPGCVAKVGALDLPLTTSSFAAITGMSVRPKVALALSTKLAATDAASTNARAEWQGIGACWENNSYPEQFSTGVQTGHTGAAVEKSVTAGLFVQRMHTAGVTDLLAYADSFRNDGLNLTMSTPDVDGVITKMGYLIIGDAPPAPVVTGVSSIQPGSSFTISGTNLIGAGSSTVTIGGVAQTVLGQSATSITCTAGLGSNRYARDYDLIVTTGDGLASLAFTVQYLPEAGIGVIDLVDPLIDATDRPTANPDLAGADQIVWTDLTLSIADDGTLNTANSATRDVKVRVHDGVSWSATQPDRSDWAVLHVVPQIPIATVIVPNVIGLDVTAATAALVAAQLILGTKTSDYSATVSNGLVFAEAPVAGDSVAQGSEVDISVSLGPRPFFPTKLQTRKKTTLRAFLLG